MLPSIVAKTLYRKLRGRSSDYKFRNFSNICYGATRVLRQELYNADSRGSWRCIHSSTYFYDKPKASDIQSLPTDNKSEQIIKQSATGDIIVKTETDANKIVTKVVIEKSQGASPSTTSTAPPGTCAL